MKNKNKKSTGGQLLATGVSLIPGYGQILGPAVGIVDSLIDKRKQEKMLQQQNAKPIEQSSNPFGNLALGGILNDTFKQYNTGSHASGKDLNVDQNGNSSAKGVAAVQNQENSFKTNSGQYVYSDTLINPESGRTFNKDAAKVNSRYNNAKHNPDEKAALNFEMERLSKLNDIMKQGVEKPNNKLPNGGLIASMMKNNPNLMADISGANDVIRNRPYMTPDGKIVQPNNDNLQISPIESNGLVPAGNTPFENIETGLTTGNTQVVPEQSFVGKPAEPRQVDFSNTDSQLNTEDRGGGTPPPSDKKDFNYNTVAIGLKGLGLLKSGLDAITPAEKESPILPDYSKSDKYIQEANIDYTQAKQDALGVSNMAANMNRSASRNFSQFQQREGARFANLQDTFARIDTQENNQRSELNLRKSAYEQQKAGNIANRLYQNRIDNFQNQANADYAKEKFFTELTQVGTEFNKYQNFKEQLANNKEMSKAYINEGLALLGTKYTDFGLSSDFVEQLKSGNYDPNNPMFIQFIGSVEKRKLNGN